MRKLAILLIVGALLMPTPFWLTGFEHGVLSVNGGGLVDSISGSPSVQAVTVISGSYSLECGGAAAQAVRKIFSSTNCLIGRIKWQKTANPGSDTLLLRSENSGDYQSFVIGVEADGDIYAQVQGGTKQIFSSADNDTVYRIDFRFDSSTTTGTIDWQIDGVAQTQATNTITPGNFSYVYLCDPYNAVGDGKSFFFDDVIISATSGDYPIGAGEIIGISPNAEGTHNAGTDIIEDHNGNDIDGVTYQAYPLMDEVPMDSVADYVRQAAAGAGNYAEVQFANIPSADSINGAMGILAYTSASALANNGQTRIRDSNGQETTIYSGDMSETSLFYKSAIVLTPSGGWTEAHANALRARMGYSTDADPNPYWQALMIEVDYVPGAGPIVLVVADSTHPHSAESPVLTQAHVLAIAETLLSHLADNIDLFIGVLLAIADALHGHTAENITLSQVHNLLVNAGLHALASNPITLTQVHNLIVAGGLHEHLADNIDLILEGIEYAKMGSRPLEKEDVVLIGSKESVFIGEKGIILISEDEN